jgi:hypothetical protein
MNILGAGKMRPRICDSTSNLPLLLSGPRQLIPVVGEAQWLLVGRSV